MIGFFDEEEAAARAYNEAIRDAGLEGKRRMNAVDATGALVPKRAGTSGARPLRRGRAGPGARADRRRLPAVLGRDLGQARATVEGAI